MAPYAGNSGRGGPPQVRVLTELMITKISVGPMDNNAYLLRCRRTGDQAMIDAAADLSTLLEVIGPDGLTAIVTTHQHHDHVGALAAIAQATGATTYAHADDAHALPVKPDVQLEDGDAITVGEITLTAIHVAGHTPGGLALAYDDPHGHGHLFSGDSLFPGGVGSTRGDSQDFVRLLNDVTTKLFDRWPDDTWVYPGHGADTTLGAERPHLKEWADRGW